MSDGLVVLSLCDGTACGLLALLDAGVKVDTYYASEIDEQAIKVAMANHPEISQLGDMLKWKSWDIKIPDLIIGGLPCQSFSFAGNQLNFKDPRGQLFFTMIEMLNFYKPEYYFFENVVMQEEFANVFTDLLRVEPLRANSSLVSAQNRVRNYWCSWDIHLPEDQNIYLEDILEFGFVDRKKSYCIDASYYKGGNLEQYLKKSRRQVVFHKFDQSVEVTPNYIQRDPGGTDWKSSCTRAYFKDAKHGALTSSSGSAGSALAIVQKPHGFNKGGLKALKGKVPSMTSSAWQDNNLLAGRLVGRKLVEGKRCDSATEIKVTQRVEVNEDPTKSNCITTVQKDSILIREKSKCVRASGRSSLDRHEWDSISDWYYRKLTVLECERLQTLPCKRFQLNLTRADCLLLQEEYDLENPFSDQLLETGVLTFNVTEGFFELPRVENTPQITSRLVSLDVELDVGPIFTKQSEFWSENVKALGIQNLISLRGILTRAIPEVLNSENLRGIHCSFENGYTNHVCNSQRYKMIGNGWTMKMISHFFSSMKKSNLKGVWERKDWGKHTGKKKSLFNLIS